MSYSFKATVNYPEQSEVDTPDFDARNEQDLAQLLKRLITTEPDATSYVITIVRKGK